MSTLPRRALIATLLASGFSLSGLAQAQNDGWWGSGSNERVDGSGKRGSESRSIAGEFHNLQVSGSWTVQLRQGNSHAVTVEGDDNLLQYIETRLDGKTLHVQPKKGYRLNFKERAVVTVNFVELKSVSLGGSNNLDATTLKAERFEFNLGGGGSARFDNLDVKRFSANIGGSGSVTAKGKAEVQNYNIGGSGTVRTEGLEGEKVNVNIGGSGSLRVWAKSTLDVSIAGSGSVGYRGDPKISRSVVGSGSLRKLED